MGELTVNASASLSANGKNTATGSITWTAPALPDGVSNWDSITLTGAWKWGGSGSITSLTVNGVSTSSNTPFTVSLGSAFVPPVTVTCKGSSIFVSGNNFTWRNLIVTYAYTDPVTDEPTGLCFKENGAWVQTDKVYKKISGVWVEQTDIESLCDANAKYIRKN